MYKVLIAENNPTIIKLIAHFFKYEGCEVFIAEDGLQAMNMLDVVIPDILFTDIIMPKISGDELCQFVRQNPRFKDIFIVVYSAIAYEDENHIFDLKADLYIAKGSHDTIRSHISHVLNQFRNGKRREDILHGTKGLYSRTITKELLLSRRHYQAIMENLAEAVIEMDSRGKIVQANRAAQVLLDCELTDILSSRLADHLEGPEVTMVEQWFARDSKERSPQFSSSYDSPLWAGKHQLILKLVGVDEKDEFFTIAILQDVTQHKLTEGKLVRTVHEFNAMIESIEYGVLFMDSDLNARIANRAYRHMWGVSDEFFAGRPTFRDLINLNRFNDIYDIPEEEFDRYIAARETSVRKGCNTSEEFQRKDGVVYQYQCVVLPDGGRMLTYFDITKHKNTQAQLAQTLKESQDLANQDPLTGLPNIRLLHQRFLSAASISKRKGWKAAIIFIDLDDFKAINDIYGHIVGDMALKLVSQRLLKLVRQADTVARIGGDEFLIIQTEVRENAAVTNLAERILQQLSDPFNLAGNLIKIGASIGISMYPAHGDNIQLLIKKADKAMYKAKSLGKRNYSFALD
jgi:diguanylate cyclase (GGDEF)-like protein/PAS domain S-box-containing protein